MTREEGLEQLRAEKNVWRELAHEKHREVQQLQHEKHVVRDALKEAIQAIERLQEHAENLEGQIDVLQERVKILEGQQAKDSHNSSLPPSSDRFVRPPKSLKRDGSSLLYSTTSIDFATRIKSAHEPGIASQTVPRAV